MTYLTFAEEILDKLPDFKNYFIGEYQANEVDLLPSNLSFSLVQFLDHEERIQKTETLKQLIDILKQIRDSNEEDLVMLYNETITDISNTKLLKLAIDKIEILNMKDPHKNLSPEEISAKLKAKKDSVDKTGQLLIESNKKLLERYGSSRIAYPFEVPKKVPGGASSGQYF
jgi:hypothetical protein